MSEEFPTTDDTRAALAALLNVPTDVILHFAFVVRIPGENIVQRFCGLPDDGILLHAQAIQTLAASRSDWELLKLEAGCTACKHWPVARNE